MKLARLIVIASAIAAIVAACSHSSLSGPVTQDERVFRANCGSCHRLYDPGSRSAEEWNELLKTHDDRMELEPEKREAILRYLHSHSQSE